MIQPPEMLEPAQPGCNANTARRQKCISGKLSARFAPSRGRVIGIIVILEWFAKRYDSIGRGGGSSSDVAPEILSPFRVEFKSKDTQRPKRVDQHRWRIRNIPIDIQPSRNPNRITLQKPPRGWVIVPCPDVEEGELAVRLIPPLAGVSLTIDLAASSAFRSQPNWGLPSRRLRRIAASRPAALRAADPLGSPPNIRRKDPWRRTLRESSQAPET